MIALVCALAAATLPAGVAVESEAGAALPPKPYFDPRSNVAEGDGVATDTTAIQQPIDACAEHGGSVTHALRPQEATVHVEAC